MVTKHTFVGPGFTRKPPKYERFIRPMALRSTKVGRSIQPIPSSPSSQPIGKEMGGKWEGKEKRMKESGRVLKVMCV